MTDDTNVQSGDKPVFDASKALAELVADQPDYAARKLSFEEKCGAFAALYGGARSSIVARAFGVTQTTVSLLAGCLPYDPAPERQRYDEKTGKPIGGGYACLVANRSPNRKQHYQDVAREFIALGEDAFNERYYRPIHDRMVTAKREAMAKRPVKPAFAGPNPTADKYSWRNYGVIDMQGDFWRVSWLPDRTDPTQGGWKISVCAQDGKRLEEGFNWRGDDENDGKPFRTSAEAFDGIYVIYGEDSPRPKPGRPRK